MIEIAYAFKYSNIWNIKLKIYYEASKRSSYAISWYMHGKVFYVHFDYQSVMTSLLHTQPYVAVMAMTATICLHKS